MSSQKIQESAQSVPDPSPRERVESGNETRARRARGMINRHSYCNRGL